MEVTIVSNYMLLEPPYVDMTSLDAQQVADSTDDPHDACFFLLSFLSFKDSSHHASKPHWLWADGFWLKFKQLFLTPRHAFSALQRLTN